MKLLLTGATGFVGGRLAEVLDRMPDIELTCAVRRAGSARHGRELMVNGLDADTGWFEEAGSQDVIIHAAARAHIVKDEVSYPLAEYRRVNVDGSLNLARQAAEAGVNRFIFISSIGVNGNINKRPFTENDEPSPAEPSAQSKLEAELGLQEIGKETGMEVTVIRPPLVYGLNAPGNFDSLIRWVGRGGALPLGAIHNQRSLVALDNLVDLIVTCIDHPAAANQVFLAGDGEDLSTTELLQSVGRAMGKPARLIPVPASVLMLGASVLGKKAVAQRLLGSLQVDVSKARNLLGWEPPLSVKEGLLRCFVSENQC